LPGQRLAEALPSVDLARSSAVAQHSTRPLVT
jgi:hypothetical protein